MALVARLNVSRQINQSDLNPVGMVVYADLTEAQFQSLNGTGWVLADGRSVAGSTYATVTGNTTVSDLRGVTIRSKNNGRADGNQDPDGERALRSFQSHATAKNGLTASQASHTHTVTGNVQMQGPAGNLSHGTGGSTESYQTNPTTDSKTPIITIGAGDNETRMRNVALNPFIKIN